MPHHGRTYISDNATRPRRAAWRRWWSQRQNTLTVVIVAAVLGYASAVGGGIAAPGPMTAPRAWIMLVGGTGCVLAALAAVLWARRG